SPPGSSTGLPAPCPRRRGCPGRRLRSTARPWRGLGLVPLEVCQGLTPGVGRSIKGKNPSPRPRDSPRMNTDHDTGSPRPNEDVLSSIHPSSSTGGAVVVSELLLRWQEGRAQGKAISPEELCAGHLELLDEVRREVEALLALERMLESRTVS